MCFLYLAKGATFAIARTIGFFLMTGLSVFVMKVMVPAMNKGVEKQLGENAKSVLVLIIIVAVFQFFLIQILYLLEALTILIF